MSCNCTYEYMGPSLESTCGGGALFMFMTLLDTFIRNRCEISEMCSRVSPKSVPDAEYDFVVIGGGSGGSAVAGRLSENPDFKVLLIEAGPDEPPGAQVPSMVVSYHENPYLDWMYKTEPEPIACQGFPEKRCSWPRGKVLGGCGVINGMMYTRGTKTDFDDWARAGNEGWSYQDVLPVFKRFEDNKEIGTLVDAKYHGSGGPWTTSRFNDQPVMAYDILKAAREIGYNVSDDLNGAQYEGFSIAQANNRHGARLSPARAYLRPARDRSNLHIMLNSTATRIVINKVGNKKKAEAVEFLFKNRPYSVRVKKEVILSAGALNSPQLLLLSGVGPASELRKVGVPQVHELPGVGRNLKNHVAFYISYHLNKEKDVNDLDWATALDYLVNQKGPMSSTGMSQVTARLNSPYADPSGHRPDLQIFFAGYLAKCSKTGQVKAVVDEEHPESPRSLEISPVVLHPKSQGYVGLKSRDPLEPPLMVANYLTEPEDVATLVAGVRVIQRLMNSTTIQKKYDAVLVREDYGDCANIYGYDTDDFWQCAVKYYTGPENHQTCSCKMGPSSDRMAVVDNKLKVHGLDNVRIADASSMPKLVSGNTQATIIMMAERAVDFINERWSGSGSFSDRFSNVGQMTGVSTHKPQGYKSQGTPYIPRTPAVYSPAKSTSPPSWHASKSPHKYHHNNQHTKDGSWPEMQHPSAYQDYQQHDHHFDHQYDEYDYHHASSSFDAKVKNYEHTTPNNIQNDQNYIPRFKLRSS